MLGVRVACVMALVRAWCAAALGDLAAADFPAPWGAVSWALASFTSEFGMGSGGVTPLSHQVSRRSRARAGLARVGAGLLAGRLVLVLRRVCAACGDAEWAGLLVLAVALMRTLSQPGGWLDVRTGWLLCRVGVGASRSGD